MSWRFLRVLLGVLLGLGSCFFSVVGRLGMCVGGLVIVCWRSKLPIRHRGERRRLRKRKNFLLARLVLPSTS
ncbi:MAG: hypothetical protein UT02_C0023G0011 [Parcubacteria group bacterium GW2011_GWC2_38_7]|nr:MAG: hypothetical protein UT02_C0023G0011 [Parcubacteria group bacterium GW2011_GWC2_38_7]